MSPAHTQRIDRGELGRRGLTAIAISLLVNGVITAAVTMTGAVEPFQALTYGAVFSLTAAGALGATVVYAILLPRTDRPNRWFAVIAAVGLVISWIPDLTVVPAFPGATTDGIVVLMAMHATVAVISYAVLTR